MVANQSVVLAVESALARAFPKLDRQAFGLACGAACGLVLFLATMILVVRGGLREDEFNGGWSLRLKAAWDYEQLCAQHAQRLSLRLDLRDPAAWQRVDAVLSRHRPGPTPLRLHLQVGRNGQGATGVLDLNGSNSVRIAPPLLDALRAQPGVRAVKVAISRPWAN